MADSDGAISGLPVVREAFPRTVRLVASARLRDPVLSGLVEADDLDALAEIEGATSARLQAEHRGTATIDVRELVYGVPHAGFINASFVYARPREPNRFNGTDRGAWYAALDVATCLAEVAFHMTAFLARTGSFDATVDYVEMHASLAGEYVDLRQRPRHACLHPVPAIGYPAGNLVAEAARVQGLNGVVYPSVRHAGGTCLVALRPNAVQSVAMGDLHHLAWTGSPEPTVSRIHG